MVKYVLFFVLVITIPNISFPQSPAWKSFTDGHQVIDVAQDDQILWIATSGGIVKIDQQNNDTIFLNRSNAGFEQYNITCIEVDNLHNLWVGTDGDGVYKYDGTYWYNTPNPLILPTQKIGDIKKDSLGNIYVGCLFYLTIDWQGFPTPHPGGLLKYNGMTWTNLSNNLGNFEKNVTQIDFDQAGKLVVVDNTLNIFDGVTWIHTSIGPSSNYKIRKIAIDSLNNIYTIKAQDTLAKFDGTAWSYIPIDTILLNWNWYSHYNMIFDTMGNLWISSNNSGFPGIYKFDGTTWVIYNSINSPLITNRNSGLNLINNKLYIGSINNQLQTFDITSNSWSYIPTTNSMLYNNKLHAVYVDQNNILYTATRDTVSDKYMFVNYDGLNWNFIDSVDYVYYATINFIFIDSQGNNWLGGGGGLLKYDGNTWELFDMSNTTFLNNGINSITEDASGHIWIASGPGFISEYDGLNWTTYVMPGMVGGFGEIIVDSAGNKWMSSNYGLIKFDTAGIWTTYNTFNGPNAIDNRVYGLINDSANNRILMSTQLGIVAYDYTNFTPLTFTKHSFMKLDPNGNIWAGNTASSSGFSMEIEIFNSTGQLISAYTNGNDGYVAAYTSGPDFTTNGFAYLACEYNGILYNNLVNSVGTVEVKSEYNSGILIYPNPSNGLFNLIKHCEKSCEKYIISVFDITGKLILEMPNVDLNDNHNYIINLSENSDGVYFVKLFSKTESFFHKIVKFKE